MASFARLTLACSFGLLTASAVVAESFVYRPINPAFGGNPDIYNYLQSTADIQNQFTEEADGGGGFPVIDFPDIDIDLGGDDDQDPDPQPTGQ